jgi:hypothetical protein
VWRSPNLRRHGPRPHWVREILGRAGDAAAHEGVLGAAVVFVGFAFGILIQRKARYRTTWPHVAPPGEWPSRLADFARQVWMGYVPRDWAWALFVVGAVGLLLSAVPRVRAESGSVARACLALVPTSFAYALMMSISVPPRGRYFLPGIMLLAVGTVALAVGPLCGAIVARRRRLALYASISVLLLGTAAGHGWPSPSGVRDDLERYYGGMTGDLRDARASHLAGDYWKVWPAVFHAGLAGFERGDRRIVWGLSHRSLPTRDLWEGVGRHGLRVATPAGDEEAPGYLKAYGFPPMIRVEKLRSIQLLIPTDLKAEKPAGGPT